MRIGDKVTTPAGDIGHVVDVDERPGHVGVQLLMDMSRTVYYWRQEWCVPTPENVVPMRLSRCRRMLS